MEDRELLIAEISGLLKQAAGKREQAKKLLDEHDALVASAELLMVRLREYVRFVEHRIVVR